MYLILINLFDKSGQFASNDSEVYYFVLLLDGLQNLVAPVVDLLIG